MKQKYVVLCLDEFYAYLQISGKNINNKVYLISVGLTGKKQTKSQFEFQETQFNLDGQKQLFVVDSITMEEAQAR